MNYWLLLIPLLTAFSGWVVIRIARTMLFKPFKPVKIFGFKFQGLFPKHQQAIANHLGSMAAAEFSTFKAIEEKINDPKNFESIKPLIESHMDDFLRHRLKDQMPMIGMFIGDKTIQSLKTIFIKEIEDLFPRITPQFSSKLQDELDIEKIIVSKITSLSPGQIERSLSKNLDSGFQRASTLAILFGLLIGIIQLLLIQSLNQ